MKGDPAPELPRIEAGDTAATVDLMGGRVASFGVGRHDVLFAPSTPPPEERSWVQPAGRWMHAGIPVLFPQAGTLNDDRFDDADTTLLSHGLAYGRPWTVDLHRATRLVLSIGSDSETAAAFPFRWRLSQEIVVGPGTLRLTLRVTNQGSTPLPVAPGWHPYFAVPLEEKTGLRIDEVAGFRAPASPDVGIDDILALPRQPLHVRLPSGTIRLSTSADCRCLVVWTMPGQPFICVEPWAAFPNALNDPAQRLVVAPGATLSLWMEMAYTGHSPLAR